MREAGIIIRRVMHADTTLSRGASAGLTESISVLRAHTHLLAVFELHPVLALPLLVSDQSACKDRVADCTQMLGAREHGERKDDGNLGTLGAL